MGHDEKQALTRPVPICLRFAVGITASDVDGLAVTDDPPSCTQTGAAPVFVTMATVGVPVVGSAAFDDVAPASSTIVAVGAKEAMAMMGYPVVR
jgi:hypothetical protein